MFYAVSIAHFSASIVSRGGGRSVVLSAAYRHCAKMEYEREARTIDYTRKQGLLHEEFVIPADAPKWMRALIADRSVSGAVEAFWNKVEAFEKRSDAQLARDLTIALPLELTPEQNIALVRDFVEKHIHAKGMVADWVYHDNPGNPHIHLMTTLRPMTEEGFGSKKVAVNGEDGQPVRTKSGKILYELWAGSTGDFNVLRDGWFERLNHHLALGGIDLKIDGRSYEKQGIDLEPTIHLGVGAKAIERKAQQQGVRPELERIELNEQRRSENARRILNNPAIVLDVITREKSVFDERDVAKVLHRYVDDPTVFQKLMLRIILNPEVLRLQPDTIEFATGEKVPARYSTRAMIRLEATMVRQALWLSDRDGQPVSEAALDATFRRHERLSQEQKAAIERIAGPARIAAVVGRAGAGKTTMMKAAARRGNSPDIVWSAERSPARRRRVWKRKPGSRAARSRRGSCAGTVVVTFSITKPSSSWTKRVWSPQNRWPALSMPSSGQVPRSFWSAIPNSSSRSRRGLPSAPSLIA